MDIVERLRLHWPDMTFELAEEAANEIERLREALGYYANKENYKNTISLGHPQIDGSISHIKLDNGDKARAALKGDE